MHSGDLFSCFLRVFLDRISCGSRCPQNRYTAETDLESWCSCLHVLECWDYRYARGQSWFYVMLGSTLLLSYTSKLLPSGLKSPSQLLFRFCLVSASLLALFWGAVVHWKWNQSPRVVLLFTPEPKERIPMASPTSQTLGTWVRGADRDRVEEDQGTKFRHTYRRPRAPPRDRQYRTLTRSPPGRSRPEGGPSPVGGAGRRRLATPPTAGSPCVGGASRAGRR